MEVFVDTVYMRRRPFLFVGIIILALAGIVIHRRVFRVPTGGLGTNPPVVTPLGTVSSNMSGINLTKITDQGGRVDWYHGTGASHDLVAYDAIVDAKQDTEVYTMNPDGSNKVCVTCNAPIPKGFTGQPAWHPDGEHIILQAESSNSKHGFFNHMGWGFDADLWIINKDGSGAQKIYSTPKGGAALHPHFSSDGKKLIFSERVPGGVSSVIWRILGPDGENPWINWQIHISDVDLSQTGTAILSNDKILYGGTGNLYETHGFTSGDQRIIFTMTKNGGMYEDDEYTAKLDGSDMVNLTNSPTTWDELANFSPSGKSLGFISSRADTSWVAPQSKANTLRTELYIKQSDGTIKQLTNFNKDMGSTHYLVSTFDWNRAGNQIIFQVAPFAGTTFQSPQIWLLTFPTAQ